MTRLISFLTALLLLPGWALAAVDPADQPAAVCEWAAMTAAKEAGVPEDILATLTLTETGRRRNGVVRPWAWSVNSEGAGSWFDDPAEALAFAQDRIDQNRLNLDIGCFQLNYRWHGENFPSVVEMFDPLENARYAARFVRDLYAETGDWRRAAGGGRVPLADAGECLEVPGPLRRSARGVPATRVRRDGRDRGDL